VSAANRGPRTDGSQFFILFSDEGEHLDGKHTVYGQVVEGLGTLRTLEMYGTETGEPTRIVVIRRSEILEQ
ncbi:MAG: peptidylprolyl isomerase, partial [Myxococcota bacterium]